MISELALKYWKGPRKSRPYVKAKAKMATIDPQGHRLLGFTTETWQPIWAPKGHSILYSANGGGKTARGLMPWLFSLLAPSDRPAILVLDSKDGEIAAQLLPMLKRMGVPTAVIDDTKVLPADAFGRIALNPMDSVVWTQLHAPEDQVFANEAVTHTLIEEPSSSEGPDRNLYFRQSPRAILEMAIYGKSMARDKVENDVGEMIKALEPSPQLITLATAMFKQAWDQRLNQAKEAATSVKKKITELDKQIEAVLERIMASSNATVIETYEEKIAKLERKKLVLTEKSAQWSPPSGSFEEKLDPLLTFLASPCKVWENGSTALRRTVLKLAFSTHITYDRNEGARTAQKALPFKALDAFADQHVCFGAVEKTRTSTGVTPQRPQRCASTNSATTARRR